MRMPIRRSLVVATALLSAGCGSQRLDGTFPTSGSLVPDARFALTPGTTVALDKIVNWGLYAGVAYLVTDPLAPNWHIEEAGLPEDRVHLSLHMKRYYAGGAGEARSVFHRRAKELMRSGGFEAYEVLEFHEGIESSVLGSQRVARGVIYLTGRRSG